eukprot:519492-Amorphochlora_amoeboformis.AAC.1
MTVLGLFAWRCSQTGTSSPREVLNLFFQKFHSDRKAPNYKTPRTPSQLVSPNTFGSFLVHILLQ